MNGEGGEFESQEANQIDTDLELAITAGSSAGALNALVNKEARMRPGDIGSSVLWAKAAYELAEIPDINKLINQETIADFRTKKVELGESGNKHLMDIIDAYYNTAQSQGGAFDARIWLLRTADTRLNEVFASNTEFLEKDKRVELAELNGKVKEELALYPEDDFSWRAALNQKAENFREAGKLEVADKLESLSALPINKEWEKVLFDITHGNTTTWSPGGLTKIPEKNEIYEDIMLIVAGKGENKTAYGYYLDAKRQFRDRHNYKKPVSSSIGGPAASQETASADLIDTETPELEKKFYKAASDNFLDYADFLEAEEKKLTQKQKDVLEQDELSRGQLTEALIRRGKYKEAEKYLDKLPNTPHSRVLRTVCSLLLSRQALETPDPNVPEAAKVHARSALKSSLGLETIPEEIGEALEKFQGSKGAMPAEVAGVLHVLKARYFLGKARLTGENLAGERAHRAGSKNSKPTKEEQECAMYLGKRLKTVDDEFKEIFSKLNPLKPKDTIKMIQGAMTDEKIRQSLYLTLLEYMAVKVDQAEFLDSKLELADGLNLYAELLKTSLGAVLTSNNADHPGNMKRDALEVLDRVCRIQVDAENKADPRHANIERLRKVADEFTKLAKMLKEGDITPSFVSTVDEMKDTVDKTDAGIQAEKNLKSVVNRITDPEMASKLGSPSFEEVDAVVGQTIPTVEHIAGLLTIYKYLEKLKGEPGVLKLRVKTGLRLLGAYETKLERTRNKGKFDRSNSETTGILTASKLFAEQLYNASTDTEVGEKLQRINAIKEELEAKPVSKKK